MPTSKYIIFRSLTSGVLPKYVGKTPKYVGPRPSTF